MNTLTKLLNLRDAVDKALGVAAADNGKPPHQQRLFASIEGMALVEAWADLSDGDATEDMLDAVRHELGLFDESLPLLPRVTQQVRKLNQSLFVDGEVG